MSKKIVAVSGYFDPVHIGHVRMFEEAAKLGDLIVIVNNDNQAVMKKGYSFMSAEERADIIRSIGCVSDVVVAIDTDRSVCATLAAIKPDVFANGGDRFADNIPEKKLCEDLGIEMVFNVGGEKIQSSSELVSRQWGHWEVLENGNKYKVKRLQVSPHRELSLQRHFRRAEHWVVVSGEATVLIGEDSNYLQRLTIKENENIYIPLKSWHQLINETDETLKVIEVATGEYIEEDDIERL